jgi:DNA-binding response OmpR family regulator
MGKRISIVDDEQPVRNMYKTFLERKGYETEVYENGERGFDAYLERRPNLMILDHNMPEMTGFEILIKIRETIGDNETPVILISGGVWSQEDINKINSYQNTKYLQKPVNLNALLATVSGFLD